MSIDDRETTRRPETGQWRRQDATGREAASWHAEEASPDGKGDADRAVLTTAGGVCPNCGAPLDDDAEVCEACGHYVRGGVCSFCGAPLSAADAFCPECGNPRGGILCPHCRTLSEFAFCPTCGAPLTKEAAAMASQQQATEQYRQMRQLADEVERLGYRVAYHNEAEHAAMNANDELKERVARLLADDEGSTPGAVTAAAAKPQHTVRLSADDLAKAKAKAEALLAEALEKMATPPSLSPARARNYAMATKPAGVRIGWVCNYKHALHSSPCACAKPQLGGKWVVMDGRTADTTTEK